MKIEMTHARAKTLAKTLRAGLGTDTASYQQTLDLIARGLGYTTYEAMKAEMAAAEETPKPTTVALSEVAVLYVAPEDRPDGLDSRQPALHVGRDRRAAETAFQSWLNAFSADRRAGDPPHRVFQLPVHDQESARRVGRHGEALPAEPTSRPANTFFKNADPVMDGTRTYERPTYYDCGICGALHPADWDGDCRDDNNRFSPEQLDEKHGPAGWDEVDMPGTEDALQEVELTHPRRGVPIVMGVCRWPNDLLVNAALTRMRDDLDALALHYTYVPAPADPEEEPRWFLRRLDARGLDDPQRADPTAELHPEEAALTADERNALVYLHETLGLDADTPITLHIDRSRAFIFPTAGEIVRYLASAHPIQVIAPYEERDDQQRTLAEEPRRLIDLIGDLEEMA